MSFDGVTTDRLRREVQTSTDDNELLNEVIASSHALVLKLVLDEADDDLPDAVFDQAHLAVAVDMFNRRKAPNGVLWTQIDDGATATPLRLSNDPLRAAYPILRLWLPLAIGGSGA